MLWGRSNCLLMAILQIFKTFQSLREILHTPIETLLFFPNFSDEKKNECSLVKEDGSKLRELWMITVYEQKNLADASPWKKLLR